MQSFRGYRVLVLEDEYMLAGAIERLLDVEGTTVLGPFASMAQVQDVVLDQVDAAILNSHVRDGPSDSLAAKLHARGIPIIVLASPKTGAKPGDWPPAAWLEKPYRPQDVLDQLGRVIRERQG